MLHIKSKKITLSLCLCLMPVLLSPVITQAASETGSIAASQAADQRAALAKKAADRQKATEEKQKTADNQKEKTDEK
jgi:ribosomal protein L12E/L44/L45/RPP1/RPP2